MGVFLTDEDVEFVRALSPAERELMLQELQSRSPAAAEDARKRLQSVQPRSFEGWTTEETADFFGIAIHTLEQNWQRSGVPSTKVGNRRYYDLREVARWLSANRGKPDGAAERQELIEATRRDQQRITELKRRKLENELVDIAELEAKIDAFVVVVRRGVEDAARVIGPAGVEALGRVLDQVEAEMLGGSHE